MVCSKKTKYKTFGGRRYELEAVYSYKKLAIHHSVYLRTVAGIRARTVKLCMNKTELNKGKQSFGVYVNK